MDLFVPSGIDLSNVAKDVKYSAFRAILTTLFENDTNGCCRPPVDNIYFSADVKKNVAYQNKSVLTNTNSMFGYSTTDFVNTIP